MVKKILLAAAAGAIIIGFMGVIANAAPYPLQEYGGGTGTNATSTAGQVLISTGSSTYTPAYLACSGGCTVTSASGTVTITAASSSALITVTINGQTGSAFNVFGDNVNTTSTTNGSTTVIKLLNSGASAATYTCATVTVNAQGIVTSASNGSCSGGGGITSINAATSSAQTLVAGAGLTATTTAGSSNATTTYTLNIGTGCSGNNFVQTISATGTITCSVPSGGASSTNVYGANGVNVVQVGVNATATLDTTYAAIWTALETFNKGLTANGTTTLASTTNAIAVTNGSGTVYAYAGSNVCGAGNAATAISATGTITCSPFVTAAITSINGNTTAAQTFTGGAGISVASASGNTTTTNTGVTSFTGAGCATAANSTGTVTLTVTCISGNQNITFKLSGDATGTASGATSITDTVTVVGLNGVSLPANTTGTLEYVSGAWVIKLATSSLGVYDASGNLSSYIGSQCGGGQYMTGLSATGTVACGTPAGSGTLSTTTPWTVGNLTLASTSNALATYGGSSCGSGIVAGISASGTAACTATSTLPQGTVTTSTAGVANDYAKWTSASALGNANTSDIGTSTYVNASTTELGAATTTGQQQFESLASTTKSYVECGQSGFACTVPGSLAYSQTSTGNGAGASTTIETYIIPSSTLLTIGDEFEVRAGGTIANTASTNKVIQLNVSSTVIFQSPSSIFPTSSASSWFLDAYCMVQSTTSSQTCAGYIAAASGTYPFDTSVSSLNYATGTTLTLYGNGTNASDTIANYFRVLYNPF
jgi:hypothetical protein